MADIPTLTELARAFYDEDGFATSNEMLVKNFEVLVPATNAGVMLALEDGQVCGFASRPSGSRSSPAPSQSSKTSMCVRSIDGGGWPRS